MMQVLYQNGTNLDQHHTSSVIFTLSVVIRKCFLNFLDSVAPKLRTAVNDKVGVMWKEFVVT